MYGQSFAGEDSGNLKNLLLHFERFGPYHLARLSAAHAFFRENGWNVIGLEISAHDSTYLWREESKPPKIECITLFPDRSYQSLSANEIIRSLSGKLQEISPDALAIGGYFSADARYLMGWARKHSKKSILMTESTRSDSRRHPVKELIKSFLLRDFDAALCGGIRHRDYLIGLGMPAKRIWTGYDAVDNDYFIRESLSRQNSERPLPLEKLGQKPFFLASNRFIPRKNLLLLLKAYSIYRGNHPQGWGLVLLGDGPQRDVLEKTCLQGHIPDVLFPGFQQIESLPAYYAAAGAFIHPALSEPWGLVVNEAMACGLPVIVSSRAGCAPDLCRHGLNGLQVDPESVDDIVSAMTLVSQDQYLHERFSRYSRRVIESYSPQQFARGLWGALQSA